MPKDPHKTGGIRHDWAAIKHEYVTNPGMTLRKVADKYGVRHHTIYEKSKAEGWFATRKEHQKKVTDKAIAKTCELQAKELADEADFLALMKGHVSKALKDQAQFNRHLKVDPVTGDVSEQILDKIDSRAIKDTMQVLKMIEEMSRSLYNIQKAEAIQKHQLDAERLQLERERFEFEKQKAEMFKPDNSNSIKIDGLEEGWAE